MANPREPPPEVGSLQPEQHIPGCFPHTSTYCMLEKKKSEKGEESGPTSGRDAPKIPSGAN